MPASQSLFFFLPYQGHNLFSTSDPIFSIPEIEQQRNNKKVACGLAVRPWQGAVSLPKEAKAARNDVTF